MSHFTSIYHRQPYAAISPSLPALSQSGRTVLITGGSSGIGFATARAFVSAGATRLIIASRSESTLSSAKARLQSYVNRKVTTIETRQLDLSSSGSIVSFWTALKADGVAVDVMVLNAADLSVRSKIAEKGALDGIRRMYETNVFGNWQMTSSFLAQGSEHGKVLINVSSAASHWNPASHAIYGNSKAAFTHALQALADEIPQGDLQVVSLHPGAIFTSAAEKAGYTKDSLPWDHEDLPAHSIVWASSAQASFLHGRFIWSHWDVDELQGMKPRLQEDPGFLRLSLKGVENLHPETMWDHIMEMEKAAR